jgi:hypothetical protein
MMRDRESAIFPCVFVTVISSRKPYRPSVSPEMLRNNLKLQPDSGRRLTNFAIFLSSAETGHPRDGQCLRKLRAFDSVSTLIDISISGYLCANTRPHKTAQSCRHERPRAVTPGNRIRRPAVQILSFAQPFVQRKTQVESYFCFQKSL